MVQMLESENKDLKNHCEKYVRGCSGKGRQCVMGNFSVEIKTMGMYKNGNVEMKNVMSGMKSLFEGLSRKQDRAEKRKQSKIGKLKGSRGEIWRKTGANFQETSPSESHREQLFQQQIVIISMKCYRPENPA